MLLDLAWHCGCLLWLWGCLSVSERNSKSNTLVKAKCVSASVGSAREDIRLSVPIFMGLSRLVLTHGGDVPV